MIESSLAVPVLVQYLQIGQYCVSPSALHLSLPLHFGHTFRCFVNKPPYSPFLNSEVKEPEARSGPKSVLNFRKSLKRYPTVQRATEPKPLIRTYFTKPKRLYTGWNPPERPLSKKF